MSVKSEKAALDILKTYSGMNPLILRMKRDIIGYQKVSLLNDFVIDYILTNKDKEPQLINKTLPIADWYGKSLQEKYEIEFAPAKIKIISYLGDAKSSYHIVGIYRKNMNPMEFFIPKKALLGNFLVKDYHNIDVDFDRYDQLSMTKDPNRRLKPHQKEAVQFLLSRKKCILADDMGVGKMESVNSLIPTPYGFKKMGDIKVGDKVFDMHGNPVEVLQVFPHKDKDIYKVTFSDGSTVRCGLEHLWYVSNINWKDKRWETLSLQQILDIGLHNKISKSQAANGTTKSNKWIIPMSAPVEYPEQDYYIHPYVLGMCIGDGNLCNGGINISIPDNEIESVENISLLLNEDYCLKREKGGVCPRYRIKRKVYWGLNEYHQEIKKLGLNVHGGEKFIPDVYKMGSVEQRKELLMGLMDSGGSISKTNNKISYSTMSERLANDIAELVCSLGGIARIHSYRRIRNGKESIEFSVRIQIAFCPFRLKRKAERYNPTFRKYLRRYIENVEFDGVEDAQCIYVDSPEHTYLTEKSYIVTHNTTSLTVAAIEGNFDAVLIICPASLKTNWKKELMWYVPERDITIIDSINAMNKGELESFLGYSVGKSNKTLNELKEEAKDKGQWKDNRFVIINYDILDDFYKIPTSRSKENMALALQASPMLQYIINKKSLIIVDEAHKLSNATSNRSKIISSLIKLGKPDSLYFATGTPITNDPQNLYCVLQFLGDPITDDWKYYMDRYCGAIRIPAKGEKEKYTNQYFNLLNRKNPNRKVESWYDLTSEEKDQLKEYISNNARMITIAKGATNLDELKLRIQHIYLRREKEDINENLPTKTVHELFYDFDMKQLMEYNRLWDDYETAQLEADPDKELNKELLEGAIYRKYCSDQMVPNTIKLVDEFISKGEKVIIATCYDDELYRLKEYYGNKCVVYNGKMNGKQKDAAQKEFMENPDVKVFIGQILAAGVGLTLTVSHIMVFNNIDFVPGNCRQMEDRIYRIGQTKPVDIYYQMFKDTQYERIWKTVMRKELVINQVIKKEAEK